MHCFAGGPDGGGEESRLSPKSYHRILRASNRDGFLSQSLDSHEKPVRLCQAQGRRNGVTCDAVALQATADHRLRIPHRSLSPCYMTLSWAPFCKRAEAPASEALARLGTKVLNTYSA